MEHPEKQHPEQKKTTIRTRIWRITKKLFILFLLTIPLDLVAAYWVHQEYVVKNPGPHVSKEYIHNLLTQDSPIYYRDGSIMNAISYKGAHRYYVEYEELPKHWLQAIVAMEDQNFWIHKGIEPLGIAKAVYRNLNGTRSGGSTLTQQTAKNIFNRDLFQKSTEERIKKILNGEEAPRTTGVAFSAKIWAKGWEALNALRLEEHFSKEEIITYYANQFQVHGTGRGLGVAARYFFDKTPSELTLHECAYLAAIVKGPNNYNPFTKKTAETREETIKKAIGRTQTVLNRMFEDGYISQKQKDEFYLSTIPFQRGHFRFENSILYDLIQEELEQPTIKKALQAAGIDNISTAGVHIRTTIDEEIQRKSYYALRHTLSKHSGMLKDYPKNAPLRRPTGIRPRLSRASKSFSFYEGMVIENDASIIVDIGGEKCTLSKDSIRNTAASLGSTRTSLKNKLKKYSRILVSKNQDDSCSIELDGSLQGGLLATQKGSIKAIVGGRKNQFYNRATQSKVQLGSTWKPLVYASALQLGWSMIDQLDNHHSAFYYSGSWYFPKGHDPAHSLSMMWTGVHSENRASVWLLYHLSDRLPIHRAKELATLVGLTQKEEETREEYIKRLKKWGINSTDNWLPSISYYKAQRETLLSMEEGPEKLALMSLQYITPLMEKLGKASIQSTKEKKHNRAVLAFNYIAMDELLLRCQEKTKSLSAELSQKDDSKSITSLFGVFEQPDPNPIRIPKDLFWNHKQQRIVCGSFESDIIVPLTEEHIESYQVVGDLELPPLWIHDQLSEETLLDIKRKMKEIRSSLALLDPYDLDFLLFHNDFIRQLNMRYVDYNIQKLGIPIQPDNEKALYMNSAIPLGLSMTLGATPISLIDINNIYQGILSGVQYTNDTIDRPIIIEEIIDDSGSLVYKPIIHTKDVFDPIIGEQIAHQLYHVIQHGTGWRAKNKIQHKSVHIPAMGKTGTTNNFLRAAFVGLLPFEQEDSWDLKEGVALSTTVGFDLERPLRGTKVLDGAKGALPIWIDSAKVIAESELLGAPSVSIPWEKSSSFLSYEDTFVNKKGKERTIQNWIYSEDQTNIYRMFHIGDSPSILAKTPLPSEEVKIDDLDFEELLNEEEEEE